MGARVGGWIDIANVSSIILSLQEDSCYVRDKRTPHPPPNIAASVPSLPDERTFVVTGLLNEDLEDGEGSHEHRQGRDKLLQSPLCTCFTISTEKGTDRRAPASTGTSKSN